MKTVLHVSFFLLFSVSLAAQCYEPQLMETRLGECTLVVTARITDSEPFYNDLGQIETEHNLEILETWFGPEEAESVKMRTYGGTINEEKMIAYPALRVGEGDIGVFLLRAVDDNGTPSSVDYRPIAAQESAMMIDTFLNVSYDQDQTFTMDSLRNRLTIFFGSEPLVAEPLVTRDYVAPAAGRMAATISSFSPATTTSGTGQLLTINGNGFGTSPGTVFFDSPDDGRGGSFTSAPASSIQSWTNTQIRVEVIGRAGTGRIQVRTANGMTGVSTSDLNVNYAVTNLQSNGNFVTARMVDDSADGDGGYDYLISNSSANGGESFAGNAAALASFRRALSTWQNDADYAIYAGAECGTTSVQLPINGDGINVVSFGSNAYDFDNRHGSGTVGVAFSYYSACGNTRFEMIGNDIMFRRNGNPNGTGGSVNYNYGTGPDGFNQTNFESVALHEIGHTHQLGHVASSTDVMNFRVNRPALRSLSSNDLGGAAYVRNLAVNYNPPIVNCGGGNDFNQQRGYTGYQADEDCASAVLPVTLLSFTGSDRDRFVDLDWATANELNNDYFDVQRSTDGRKFSSIGRVTGAGTATEQQRYRLTDERPVNGENYYRLAQVDFDGSTSISPVVLVDFRGETNTATSFFPNPVSNQLNVSYSPATSERDLLIYDQRGAVVSQLSIPANSRRLPVNVASLPTGIYLFRIGAGEAKRFVKR